MGWLVLGLPSVAQRPQLKRPEEGPVEKPPEPPKKKNVKGPRAVGLLQLNSSGKGTLIPVAILVEGQFYDASIYKADPVPMALEGGTVYEVEKAGESQGLFTVSGALHNNNPTSPTPWMGAGSYLLNGTEPAKKTHKAEDKPVGLDNDNDAPPKLSRGKEAARADQGGSSSGANAGSAGTAASGSSGQTGSKTSGDDSQKRKDQGGQSQQAPGATGQSPGAQAPQASTGAGTSGQSSGTQSSASPNSSASSSGGTKDDGGQATKSEYRPTLRRGKPTEAAPDEVDDAIKPAAASSTTKTGGGAGVVDTKPAQLTFLPAVSDGGGPQPQSYQFFWKEGEEDDRRKQMLALATNEVQAYVTAREKGAITAKTAVVKSPATKAPTRKLVPKAEPVFENIQFRAFDVWRNNQPVMVLTAEAHLPTAAAGASSPPLVYDITIAARTDIYGDVRKLYAGVTDKFHLDVTPRLELIDAVDADGDGRGELLFRETSDAGNGYVIYRATGDTLWKMFDSLGGV
jgi:hypothetical protein